MKRTNNRIRLRREEIRVLMLDKNGLGAAVGGLLPTSHKTCSDDPACDPDPPK